MTANTKVVDPHEVDENPEELMGEEILDPWLDEEQTDWPMDETQNDDEQDDPEVSN